MPPISRGFHRRRPEVDSARVPPGQYVVNDFPVLSAGPTPRTPLAEWDFAIRGVVKNRCPGPGRATATTTTAIPGKSSATGVTTEWLAHRLVAARDGLDMPTPDE